jgi:hypothetical protein
VLTSAVPFEFPQLKILQLLKRATIGTKHTSRERNQSRFLIEALERFVPLAPIEAVACLSRYIFAAADVKVEVVPLISYKELIDDPKLQQASKHQLKRSIAAFVAMMSGLDISASVPLAVKARPFVNVCVSVVLSVFHGMKNTKLNQYCDVIPFSEQFDLDSPKILGLRFLLFSKVLEKFPKLAKEFRDGGTGMLRGRKRDPGNDFYWDLSLHDMYAAALLLPYVMRTDMIRDFLKDEVKKKESSPGYGAAGS